MSGRHYSTGKEIDALVRALVRDEGWSFERCKRHGKLRSPSGDTVSVPSSPTSSPRSFLNFRAEIRRIQESNK
jgi:hypothetical protein